MWLLLGGGGRSRGRHPAFLLLLPLLVAAYLVWAVLTNLWGVTEQPEKLPPTPAQRLALARAKPTLTFLSIGDWGRNTPQKLQLADTMALWAQRHRCDFVVSCGDSFYSSPPAHLTHGIASVSDPYIQECFERVFHHESLQVRWYVCLGNHDYPPHAPKTNVQAQIAYTNISQRWYLPSSYYAATVAAAGFSVDLFVLDHYDPTEYNSISTSSPYPKQMRWLELQLQRSTAEWKILVCHRPIYSSGSWHGSYPRWKRVVYPLMLKYGVQVYFTGDDHILEALRDTEGVLHIVSGAGSHMHAFSHKHVPQSLFKSNTHGFTFHSLNRTHLHTELVNFEGTVLFQVDHPQTPPTELVV